MMMKAGDSHRVDFVVVGCGVAGLRAAIELGQAGNVLVLAKSKSSESASALTQGGIAAALSDEDEINLHEKDTVEAGDGLCNPEAAKVLVGEGPQYIEQLIEWGIRFDRAGTKLAFTREATHSRSRVLHAQNDSTGREINRALSAKVQRLEHIEIRAHAFTTELLVEEGRVVGLRFLDEIENTVHDVGTGAALLTTGGLGQAYRETTNPCVSTGDGMAIAYDAGAVLADLEFVQFHPTVLAVKGAPRVLLSEALRRDGGVLCNIDLDRFMKRYHEAVELAPRDVVARAIVTEMQRTRAEHVYLDLTALDEEFIRRRFPRIYSTCQSYGLDIASDLVPVRPAVHFTMGGVKTDLWGRTTLPGLYAAGETACTGVHGANRLVSNSLLEGLVFGARTGIAMVQDVRSTKKKAASASTPGNPGKSSPHNPGPSGKRGRDNPGDAKPASTPGPHPAVLEQIRTILWKDVGIIRNGRDLSLAVEQLGALEIERPEEPSRPAYELHNIWTLAQLIARSALAREESRGSHYRSDFPYRNDDDFKKHSRIARGKKVSFE